MTAQCNQYLAALFGDAGPGTFVEIRFRTDSGMGRAFYATDRLTDAASLITELAQTTDVYVGILARRRQASRRQDVVGTARVLWADCDSQPSVDALRDVSPAASLVIASGSGNNMHAYWLLRDAVSLETIEAANRNIADRLGADLSASDAARILRPPARGGNHKHHPPADVRLLHCDASGTYRVAQIVDVHELASQHRSLSVQRQRDRDDPLLSVAPSIYVERLTGLRPSRSGTVACPFHDDHTPSLHVYSDPARGWFCFGCRRGGSVYDFAALLFGLSPRGADFVELRHRLELLFDHTDLGGA